MDTSPENGAAASSAADTSVIDVRRYIISLPQLKRHRTVVSSGDDDQGEPTYKITYTIDSDDRDVIEKAISALAECGDSDDDDDDDDDA